MSKQDFDEKSLWKKVVQKEEKATESKDIWKFFLEKPIKIDSSNSRSPVLDLTYVNYLRNYLSAHFLREKSNR